MTEQRFCVWCGRKGTRGFRVSWVGSGKYECASCRACREREWRLSETDMLVLKQRLWRSAQ